MSTLTLNLKAEYFNAIKSGEKVEEYRLCTPHWNKRLGYPDGWRNSELYDRIELCLGYPKRGDQSRRIIRPWRGCVIKTITHPHFGPEPVRVYAINVAAGAPHDRP